MQIVIGLFLLIVIATLIAAKMESISHQMKMHILKIAAAIFGALWLYEANVDHSEERTRELYIAFKQGKTIICEDQNVTRENLKPVPNRLSVPSKRDRSPVWSTRQSHAK